MFDIFDFDTMNNSNRAISNNPPLFLVPLEFRNGVAPEFISQIVLALEHLRQSPIPRAFNQSDPG